MFIEARERALSKMSCDLLKSLGREDMPGGDGEVVELGVRILNDCGVGIGELGEGLREKFLQALRILSLDPELPPLIIREGPFCPTVQETLDRLGYTSSLETFNTMRKKGER